MRPFEYRGQDTQGVWRYGSLILSQGYARIQEVSGMTYNVNAYTVGEYTGKHDIKEHKIYEGDIIFSPSEFAHSLTGVVTFDNERGAMLVKLVKVPTESVLGWKFLSAFKGEVVGNIHDNPEVLKSDL